MEITLQTNKGKIKLSADSEIELKKKVLANVPLTQFEMKKIFEKIEKRKKNEVKEKEE